MFVVRWLQPQVLGQRNDLLNLNNGQPPVLYQPRCLLLILHFPAQPARQLSANFNWFPAKCADTPDYGASA